MAFQNLPDLGYKDDGPLGAFFAGINGGNANVASQLANAQAAENLQQSQFDDPLKSLENIYSAKLATAKSNDPNYIPAQLLGQIGQMKSQQFAGKKAEALSDFDIANERQRLVNGRISGEIDQKTFEEQMKMINELLAGGTQQQSSPIGFQMNPSPEYRKENYGNEGYGLTKESMLRPFMGTGYTSGNPGYDETTTNQKLQQATPQIVQAERARLLAEGNADMPPSGVPAGGGTMQTAPVQTSWSGQGGPVFSNMAGGGNRQTPYNDLIPTQSLLAKMSGVQTLNPKFIGDMAKQETRIDSAEDIARMRAMNAASNAQKTMSEPKYNEQLAKHRDIVATVETKLAMKKPVSEAEYIEYRKAFNWIQDHNITRQIANGRNFTGSPGLEQFGITRDPSPISQVQSAQPMPFNGSTQQQVSPQQSKGVIKLD